MPISIDWGTGVITVPQSDLLQVQSTPIEVYELNINDFRLELRDLEDGDLGMPFPETHEHVPPLTVAGVTLARVVEILEPYTLTFVPNLPYGVNIVGGNSNLADRTNPNNVSVRSANSAGLQDSESLQASSFDGEVTIDVINGVTGTTFPRGTQQTPVNNLADAHAIAEERGISRFLIRESMTLANEAMSDGYTFRADKVGTTVTCDASADLTNAAFEDIVVTGVLDGNNRFRTCEIDNLSTWGQFRRCGLSGTLTLTGTGGQLSQLIDCHSDVAGGGPGQYANVDMNASGNDLLVRNYHGGLGILNMADAAGDVSIDMSSGRVTVYADCTVGGLTIRGISSVIDNSTGAFVVNDLTIERSIAIQEKILRNRRETNPVTGKQTLYDDDSTTVLIEGDLFEDVAGSQPYQGQGADRADRME